MADVTLDKLEDYTFTVRGSDGGVIVDLDPLDVVMKMVKDTGDELDKFARASGLQKLNRCHQAQVYNAFDEHLSSIKKKVKWLQGSQQPTGSTSPDVQTENTG